MERTKAYCRTLVQRAIQAGTLKRQPCSKCGEDLRVEAHHEDYSKPLDIIWLCNSCHKRLHLKMKPYPTSKLQRGYAMERVSVSFGPPAMKWLETEAKRLGCSIGELIRRLIDAARESK